LTRPGARNNAIVGRRFPLELDATADPADRRVDARDNVDDGLYEPPPIITTHEVRVLVHDNGVQLLVAEAIDETGRKDDHGTPEPERARDRNAVGRAQQHGPGLRARGSP
jgi:hypothetical protein